MAHPELVAVERIGLRAVVELDHDRVARRFPRSLPQAPYLPPLARAREHPRRLGLDAVVDRRQHLDPIVRIEQPRLPERLVVPGPRVLLRQLDVAGQRGEAVPEAAVDASLGGVQRRDRLAALVGVRELAPHDRRQHAAAAVRRQHADGHHARGRDLRASGHSRFEAVGARAADDLAAVEPGKHALRGQDRREPLELLGLGPAAEVVPDRRQRGADLLRRGLPDLDHAIRSSGA